MMVAALYVETGGCYFGLPDVDPWDIARDARKYAGPYPVVAHPPCPRWGRFWHGSTRKPHQFKLGADEGCFAAGLTAVRNWNGVLEHPGDSLAWEYFGLTTPARGQGWTEPDKWGGAVLLHRTGALRPCRPKNHVALRLRGSVPFLELVAWRAAASSNGVGAARLRQSQADRHAGHGGWQGQDQDTKCNTASVSRFVAFHRSLELA